jgi:hypothetical protein
MIKGTVALPLWKMKDIAWLCIESLCRMHKPVDGWELIIFEEDHEEKLGEDFFYSYEQRLSAAGCEMIKYFDSWHKYPLSQKWVMIASQAELTSEYFCLCAGDNYYSPYMLQEAEEHIKEADWCVTTQGYFYDINLDIICRYDYCAPIGLQMVAKTDLVKRFPLEEVNKGVDMWFSRQIGTDVMVTMSPHWNKILCTNGMNLISVERKDFFTDPLPPYYETDVTLEEIVPRDIATKLKNLKQCLKLQ